MTVWRSDHFSLDGSGSGLVKSLEARKRSAKGERSTPVTLMKEPQNRRISF